MMDNQLESVKLKEIALIGDGAHASLKREDSGILYLTSKNFKQDGISLDAVDYISEETYQKYFKESSKALTKPKENDILLSIIGTMGAPYIVKENDVFGLSSSVSIIRPNNEIVDSKYLYYWIKSPMFQGSIESIKSGVAQSFLSLPMIGSLPIKYPKDLKQQKKIAKILSNYDDLIENNLKQIKLLEEKARLTYEEWFLRFRINGIKLDIDEKTGLPSGWIKQELSSIVKFEGGFAFKSETYEENQKFKIVTIKNVQDGIFIPNTTDTLSSIPDKVKKYQVLKNGDIIMSLTGNVGRVCLVYGENYLLNQRVVKITPIKKNDYSYVYSMFRHSSMLTMLENISNGAAQQNLSPVSTGKLKVVVPTDEIRKQYEKIVNPIINNIINYNLQNQLLKESRDILLPRLMTGMIDVEKLDSEV